MTTEWVIAVERRLNRIEAAIFPVPYPPYSPMEYRYCSVHDTCSLHMWDPKCHFVVLVEKRP
jgi:hypothetical protein